MIVDSHNSRIGYLVGRLFAVVEHAQGLCQVGLDESIRMRFVGAASDTPQKVLPDILRAYNKCYVALMKKKSDEIGILEEIMDEIGSLLKCTEEGVPKALTTREQCDFFIGLRHQRSDLLRRRHDR